MSAKVQWSTMRSSQHLSSEGEVIRSELERQLSVLLAAQSEQDQHIALVTSLLDQVEVNAEEAVKRVGLELHKHADQLLTQTSLVKQRDAELLDMQARLDELILSCDQQHEKELANVVIVV
jgi:hypothetical protein